MLIPVSYGKRHTFSVVAERCAELRCAGCGNAFRVFDQVSAVSEQFSILGLQDKKAKEKARQAAMEILGEQAVRIYPVPCPACGRYH